MNERQDKDPSEDLAGWLADVGRRTWRSSQAPATAAREVPAQPAADLLACLEELAGRKFKTREDIQQYFHDLSQKERDASGVFRRKRVMKDTLLLLALLTAYIQYHFLDINLQIARLPSTLVFVPVEATVSPPRQSVDVPRGNVSHANAVSSAPADRAGRSASPA